MAKEKRTIKSVRDLVGDTVANIDLTADLTGLDNLVITFASGRRIRASGDRFYCYIDVPTETDLTPQDLEEHMGDGINARATFSKDTGYTFSYGNRRIVVSTDGTAKMYNITEHEATP
jgi:hypothetical protein